MCCPDLIQGRNCRLCCWERCRWAIISCKLLQQVPQYLWATSPRPQLFKDDPHATADQLGVLKVLSLCPNIPFYLQRSLCGWLRLSIQHHNSTFPFVKSCFLLLPLPKALILRVLSMNIINTKLYLRVYFHENPNYDSWYQEWYKKSRK